MNAESTSHECCIGVDGCPGGWIGVSRRAVRVDASLAALIDALDARIVAIDMPIGLPQHAPRECEQLARRLLRRPRAASVFPVPMRPALAGHDHQHASDLNQQACGKRLPVQTFNIMAKIRTVDALLAEQPVRATQLWETHPEISFAAMNRDADGPRALQCGKKTRYGAEQRRALIASCFGSMAFADARAAVSKQDAANDDIADAFACLFTAERIAANCHVCLPDPAPSDARGLPMRICY